MKMAEFQFGELTKARTEESSKRREPEIVFSPEENTARKYVEKNVKTLRVPEPGTIVLMEKFFLETAQGFVGDNRRHAVSIIHLKGKILKKLPQIAILARNTSL